MRKYNQLIYGVDYAVGMIREELERQGVADNTVILFLSDNGYSMGAHGFGGKVLPYEEASRTPMLMFDPRHASSGKHYQVKAVTANIDMAPTIMELAGLPIPDNMDGKSLLPLLENPSDKVRDDLLLIQAWGEAPTHALTLVSEDYKYIYWPYSGSRGGVQMQAAEELYHLSRDRQEMNNLVNNPESQKILADMRQRYDAKLAIWKAECIAEGNYPEFAAIYDRNLSWDEKLAQMNPKLKKPIYRSKLTAKGSQKGNDKQKKLTKEERKAKQAAKKAAAKES